MSAPHSQAFPTGKLVLLAAAGFLTMLTETVPAGLLPAMGRDLGSGDALTGQLLTAYAGASMVAAIPLVAATAGVARKHLIVATIIGVTIANLITALSPIFWIAAAARLIGGAAAALQWALLAGYAMRMVDPARQGRALSIAMGGIPLALAIGVPLGTYLGDIFDWRLVFLTIAAFGFLLALASVKALPAVAGSGSSGGASWRVLRLPGLAIVLVGAGAFQLGHMNLYTYIAPYLGELGTMLPVSGFLFTLGLAAIAGLFLTGIVVDRHLTRVAIAAMAAFCLAMLLLATIGGAPAILIAAVCWGLGLGASPTVFQTACARVAGPQIDQAQSLLVTIFNAGMALGSAIGGALLDQARSTASLPWVSLGIFAGIATLLILTSARSLPANAASLNPT